jgi:hypothetical protein
MRFSIGKNGFLAVCLIAAASLAGFSPTVSLGDDGIASDAIINRAGLTVEWFTHSGVSSSGELADWHINVDENKSTTFFTIEAGSYREKFSQHTLGPSGKPYGIDGALEYAAIRKEVLEAELANEGLKDVEVKIDQYSLPETTVYIMTSSGVVKAIDGDSGETKWSTEVGSPRNPSIGLGANHSYVAAVNGSRVYCLEAATGKELWSAQCRYAAGSSPTVADDRIYVPLFNGRLESFGIKNKGLDPYAFVSMGEGTARPLTTEKTVAWPTSRGELNVASRFGDKNGVAYQLRSDAAIVSSATFKEGMFFVTSLDGFVYAVDEDRGSIVWQVSTGHSISQSPMPLGNHVYVINDKKELYKFDAKTGVNAPGWEVPQKNIQRFVGAGKSNLYVLDRFGQLKVLSQKSGAVLSSVGLGSVKATLPNLQTDRLYVVSDRGMIQCIREVSSPVPHFHSNEFVAVEVDPAQATTKPGDGAPPKKPVDADLDDPFKSIDAAGAPPAKEKSPLVDDDDPFK